MRDELPVRKLQYLQAIDANQDNFEECLKIRNIIGEFEEYQASQQSP